MVQSCCAFNCKEKYQKDSGITFHRFPKDPNLKTKWIAALRRDNFVPSRFSTLCSKHFVRDCFEDNTYKPGNNFCLKKTAIPTIFDFSLPNKSGSTKRMISLVNTNENLESKQKHHSITDDSAMNSPKASVSDCTVHENTSPTMTKQSRTVRNCAACHCSEMSENGRKVTYYLFPINPELRKKWLSASRLKNSDLTQFACLCSKHFEENCFENVTLGTLKEDAVPTRFFEVNTLNRVPSSDDTINLPFCIVKSCKHQGNIRGITYHRIPVNNYENWINALKDFSKVDPVPSNSRVCSMHFRAKDFIIYGNKIKLNNDAIPKLHINELLSNESSSINASDPFFNNEIQQKSVNIFKDNGVKKLRQAVLLSSVITPPADIVKSDFAVIDINTIINKKIEHDLNTITKKPTNLTQNLINKSIIKAMHNYCNDNIDNNKTSVVKSVNVEKINNYEKLETSTSALNLFQSSSSNKNTNSDENDEEYKNKRNLVRKLRAYKKAYKKHKSLNRLQSDNIIVLENKLEENVGKNNKLEQRILVLEDIIQNLLRKREENSNDMDL